MAIQKEKIELFLYVTRMSILIRWIVFAVLENGKKEAINL